jgi:hypothetical protein
VLNCIDWNLTSPITKTMAHSSCDNVCLSVSLLFNIVFHFFHHIVFSSLICVVFTIFIAINIFIALFVVWMILQILCWLFFILNDSIVNFYFLNKKMDFDFSRVSHLDKIRFAHEFISRVVFNLQVVELDLTQILIW